MAIEHFQIEKGVPLPADSSRDKAKYPFADMKVGDSFLADAPRDNLASAATYARQRHGGRYTVRKVDGGFRVWRTA